MKPKISNCQITDVGPCKNEEKIIEPGLKFVGGNYYATKEWANANRKNENILSANYDVKNLSKYPIEIKFQGFQCQ